MSTITHDGYVFPGLHGEIQRGDPDAPVIVGQFVGVQGESHLLDETKGRDLRCETLLTGYATKAACDAALDAVANKANRLTGTLTEEVGAGTTTYPSVTFRGYTTIHGPRYDGSGLNGWSSKIMLRWRERAV